MMRVAFLSHLSEMSGSGIALTRLIAGLQNEGIDGELILPGDGPLADYARQLGLIPRILDNPEQDFAGGWSHKLAMLKKRRQWMGKLQTVLEDGPFDLVYINSSASIFPGLAAKSAGIPIVWHVHETLTARGAKVRIKTGVIRRLSRAICYASESGREALPHPPGKPWLIVRNPIDTGTLLSMGKRKLEKFAADHGPARIMMNGTVPLKGADLAIAAVATVNAAGVNCELTIAGPEPQHDFAEKLEYLMGQPDLAGKIGLAGMQSSLVPLMEESDLFLSASRTEAMPISVVEAMAAGLPVVATDVGDCRAMLGNGEAGMVVEPESADALAVGIARALTEKDETLRRAQVAYDKVAQLYGGDDFYRPLAEFLKKQLR